MPASPLAVAFLAARDRRSQALAAGLRAGCRATVFVSLNLPGEDKTPPGARTLFDEALARLLALGADASVLAAGDDALGPYAIVGFDAEPLALKRRCVALEAGEPRGRLVDLDVHAADGAQVGRERLGLPARTCLVCADAAVDCMRNRRHSLAEVVAAAHGLLARGA